MTHQYRLLQAEHEIQLEKTGKLEEEYRLLKDEYSKLQTEYNEWIELIEQDQS